MKLAYAGLAVLAAASTTTADYTMSVATPTGATEATIDYTSGLLDDRLLDLEIAITSDGSDSHNSAIFQIWFATSVGGPDASGIVYRSYSWSSPYETGNIFDDSTPAIGDLPLPIDADSLSGVGYADDVVDVELSNVVPSGTFGEGTIVTVQFEIPQSWSGPDRVFITMLPDTVANGFTEIDTTAEEPFTLNIIPGPATAGVFAAFLPLLRRRRTG